MNAQRKPLIAQIHIAKKDLQLDDDTYRALLANAANGKQSCASMSIQELEAVKKALVQRGWKPLVKSRLKPRQYSPKTTHKPPLEKNVADKIRAIWIDMAKHGYIQGGSERALGSLCHRMKRRQSVTWLTPTEQIQFLEQLKKMGARLAEQAIASLWTEAGWEGEPRQQIAKWKALQERTPQYQQLADWHQQLLKEHPDHA